MALFHFRWNSNTLFFPVISALFYDLTYFSDYRLHCLGENNEVVHICINCIAYMCNIFIELVRYCIVGPTKHPYDAPLTSFASFNSEKEKLKIKKRTSTICTIFMLILYTILDLYPSIIPSVTFSEIEKEKEVTQKEVTNFVTSAAMVKMFRFIYFTMLMYFFFRTPLFIHQKIAIAIIIIGIVCILIIGEFLKIWGGEPDLLLLLEYVGVYLVTYFLTSCKAIVAKWLMDFKYFSPYQMLSIVGVIKLIMAGISYVIIQYGHCKYDFCGSLTAQIEMKIQSPYIIYYVLLFMGNMLTGTFYMLTISFLSPVYIGISDGIGAMGIWIMFIILNREINTYLLVLTIVLFLIIIFGGMIYTENLILRCCGLDKNTRESIIQRGNKSFQNGNKAFDAAIESLSDSNSARESFGIEFE